MINIRIAHRETIPQLRDLIRRGNDTPYDLGHVIDEKFFGRGADGEPTVGVVGESQIDGAAVVCGRYLRVLVVAREARERGLGNALVDWASRVAASFGATKLVAGGEPGNYFVPGVLRGDDRAQRFFKSRGFLVTGEAISLTARLEGVDWDSRHRVIEGVTIERARNREVVGEFIARHFGRLWRFEVDHAFEFAAPPLYIARSGDELLGFSAHDVNNRGLGFYGPAGIVAERRGGGLGRELLLSSLSDLVARGYDQTIIPWVSSIDFYRKVAHAEPSETFLTMERQL